MNFEYTFLDCGNERRLERFGETIIDRPCPAATWDLNSRVGEWKQVQALYDRSVLRDWMPESVFPDPWHIDVDGLTIELRPSRNSQVGVFPEQWDNWRWMKEQIRKANRPLKILNTFAYTGVATLMASSVNESVEVCHVDGAKSSVAWAKKNAELSGLSDRPIRWIADDVLTFLKREVKRGRKYDGIILDPPAFGRGKGGTWKIERDIAMLLDLVNDLLSDNPCFVILSCHVPVWTAQSMANQLKGLSKLKKARFESMDLVIPSEKGNELPAGLCGRASSS